MEFMEYVRSTGYLFSIFSFKDCFEIFICSYISYRWIHFLKKDITKPLVQYYYLFCALTGVTVLFNLPTLTTAHLFFLPTISVIFFLVHQRTLQKNIIQITSNTHKNTAITLNDEWTTVLMQSMGRVPKHKLPFFCIIERNHALALLVENPCPLNAAISEPFLRILVESEQLHKNTLLWVQDNGAVRGVNCTFIHTLQDDHINTKNDIVAQATLVSAHIDAIIIGRLHTDHGYTVIAQGVQLEQVSIAHAIRIIKQHCVEKSSEYSLHRGNHEKQNSTLSH